MLAEYTYWVTITYAEYTRVCGDTFQAPQDVNEIIVDNGMTIASPSRFSLGWISCMAREYESEICM